MPDDVLVHPDFDVLLRLGWVALSNGYGVHVSQIGERSAMEIGGVAHPRTLEEIVSVSDNALRGEAIWTVSVLCRDQIVRYVGWWRNDRDGAEAVAVSIRAAVEVGGHG